MVFGAGRRLLARRWILAGGTVLVVGLIITASWAVTRSNPAKAAPTRLVPASLGTLRQTVTSTGTIQPANQANLSFPFAGQVTAVSVAAGQRVSTGQPLATESSATLAAAVAQAQATVTSDASRLSTDQAATASSAQLAADQAALTAAQGQLANAQKSLAEATLTAPIDGVVAVVNLTVGQQVAGASAGAAANAGGSGTAASGGGTGGSGSNAGGGGAGGNGAAGGGTSGGTGGGTAGGASATTAATSAQLVVLGTDSWVVDASVDDTQVGLLAVGDQAEIVPNGATTRIYGTIGSIGLIGTSTGGVATYPVVVNVTGNPPGLHAGAGAALTLIYRQIANTLTVPAAAVQVVAGKPVVYQLVNGKQVAHPVATGLTANGVTQITDGLQDGDEVVVSGSTVRRTGGTGTGRPSSGTSGGGFGDTGVGTGGGRPGAGAGG